MLTPVPADSRGDTLVEVIFATAVLALIIVISLSIMNRGTLLSERAVEGTFVRQEIDSQTELLRYARDSYATGDASAVTLWNAIAGKRVNTSAVMQFSSLASNASCKPTGGNSFWLATSGNAVVLEPSSGASFTSPGAFAQPGSGLWVQAASNQPGDNYLDFYIYACWDSPGGNNNATTATIVRLYVPA